MLSERGEKSLKSKSPSKLSHQASRRINIKSLRKPKIKKKKTEAQIQQEQKLETQREWQDQNFIPNPDKIELTNEEKNKIEDRLLEAINPNAPNNIVRYSYVDQQFKFEPSVEQTAFHYKDDGNVIRRDSEEAKYVKESTPTIRNQFTYSERATQTFHDSVKDRAIRTAPPPSVEFSATVTQWEIYDTYQQHIANQKKSSKKSKSTEAKSADVPEKPKVGYEIFNSENMKRSAKLMERMINQNEFDDILYDFKFWDDESDKLREFGRLLPLWRFVHAPFKKKNVSCLCWNPRYHDFFAVGFGSYDFLKQGAGAICCYSLKNPSYPEYIFTTESGVMCVDFHPKHPSLLAVGLYDGTVMIYDIRQKTDVPIIKSTVKTGKHSDCVWEVRWQPESISQNLSFYSISSDGRVTHWTLCKNELQYTDIMHLKMEGKFEGEDASEATLVGLAGGTCFDFNKKNQHLFVVGTEEGKIHLCSTAYNSQYLKTYEGHNMSVYAVKWNYYHPNVFISASADWTVKIWEQNYTRPMMTFDLGSSVGDVAWAPYSSTVFAAVTDDGKVHVYDLNSNKNDSICDQLVVKKAKLTHITFNPTEPIILVGDGRGLVQTLKLSPNLRVTVQEPQALSDERSRRSAISETNPDAPHSSKKKETKTKEQVQIERLDKILQIQIKSFSQGY